MRMLSKWSGLIYSPGVKPTLGADSALGMSALEPY
jgi:hypothetical protein